ncbi:hypothetical protein [Sphingobacterium siyangense]|uniref:hypothetical protein n=2 Tax=Sphingobacterium TaxID=28453 RepID=UPI00289929B8|nr:hypothetical protein [Sphingobacterium siyangense]
MDQRVSAVFMKDGVIWSVGETDMSETDVRTISQEVGIDKRIYFLNDQSRQMYACFEFDLFSILKYCGIVLL